MRQLHEDCHPELWAGPKCHIVVSGWTVLNLVVTYHNDAPEPVAGWSLVLVTGPPALFAAEALLVSTPLCLILSPAMFFRRLPIGAPCEQHRDQRCQSGEGIDHGWIFRA